MKINVKAKNTQVTEPLTDYIEKRFAKLEKYFVNADLTGTVTLVVEKGLHRVEATIPLNRYILRAEDSSNDMYASIDGVVDKLERQIRKYKTKINRKGKVQTINDLPPAQDAAPVAEPSATEEEVDPSVAAAEAAARARAEVVNAHLERIGTYASSKSTTTKHFVKRLQMLLPLIAEGADVNVTTEATKGNTALHYACAVGDVELVKWLLDNGADVMAKTAQGKLPIECISGKQADELYKILKAAMPAAK